MLAVRAVAWRPCGKVDASKGEVRLGSRVWAKARARQMSARIRLRLRARSVVVTATARARGPVALCPSAHRRGVVPSVSTAATRGVEARRRSPVHQACALVREGGRVQARAEGRTEKSKPKLRARTRTRRGQVRPHAQQVLAGPRRCLTHGSELQHCRATLGRGGKGVGGRCAPRYAELCSSV
jgi:hypothetical protein